MGACGPSISFPLLSGGAAWPHLSRVGLLIPDGAEVIRKHSPPTPTCLLSVEKVSQRISLIREMRNAETKEIKEAQIIIM